MTEPEATRRELLRGGVVLGGVLVGAGAAPAAGATVASGGRAAAAGVPGASGGDPGVPVAPGAGDPAVLASLLRVEQVLVVAYERALAAAPFAPAVASLLREFLAHEHEHVRALSYRMASLGAPIPPAPVRPAAFEAELRRLRVRRTPLQRRGARGQVSFLVGLEALIARHYRYAIARLTGEDILVMAAEIMGNEAQHATVLREVLSPGKVGRAVPTGFVAGKT